MKIEKGVMVMKNGLAWSESDGYSDSHSWVKPEDAPIHNSKFCLKTTDVTYKGSPDIEELLTAELVKVQRITVVEVEHE